jgi:hypothetical protein
MDSVYGEQRDREDAGEENERGNRTEINTLKAFRGLHSSVETFSLTVVNSPVLNSLGSL